MPPPRIIHIVQGYANGDLQLREPNGHPGSAITVEPGTEIHWIVLGSSGVVRIDSIVPKPWSSYSIFSMLPRRQGNRFEATVKSGIDSSWFEYAIYWDSDTTVSGNRSFDPLMSVNPSLTLDKQITDYTAYFGTAILFFAVCGIVLLSIILSKLVNIKKKIDKLPV